MIATTVDHTHHLVAEAIVAVIEAVRGVMRHTRKERDDW